jgi:hypothetical protein
MRFVPERGFHLLIALYISYLVTLFLVRFLFSQQFFYLGPLEKNPTKLWGANLPLYTPMYKTGKMVKEQDSHFANFYQN